MPKKLILTLFAILSLVGSFPSFTYAIEDPLALPNNKFGIHIISENDLEDAATLVNSSGGDWGYVTLVIREDERDVGHWQKVFNKMRDLHLIPLVRIATTQTPKGWSQLKITEVGAWINFLDSLEWVIKNRYVIVGNEPNHIAEWEGELSPEEYTDYLIEFSQKAKLASFDFFILQAGFDASAPTNKKHMNGETYIKRMVEHNKQVFEHIDGWSSHSYPNPAFSGLVTDTGRGSIRTFEWELQLLETLGVEKRLPVFITETGWAHDAEGDGNYATASKITENFKEAFANAWNDDRIVAVTPFILSYPSMPFAKFSWKGTNGEYYSFYHDLVNVTKTKGEPLIDKSLYKPPKPQVLETYFVYDLFHRFWIT